VIAGATDAAKAAGWDVKVVDTQASADQANAGMSSFAVQKVDAIMVLAFASSSIGSGLAAANAASIPVASWGGEIVPGIIVTTSGQTVGEDSAKYLLDKVGDNADVLAMTFHPGKLCIDRGDASTLPSKQSRPFHHIQRGDRAGSGAERQRHRAAVAHAHPAGGKKPLAIWACWDEPPCRARSCGASAGGATTSRRSPSMAARKRFSLVKDGDMTATVFQPAYQEGSGDVPGDPRLNRCRKILGAQDHRDPGDRRRRTTSTSSSPTIRMVSEGGVGAARDPGANGSPTPGSIFGV
jgi:ribose transport system substrate-binding protein